MTAAQPELVRAIDEVVCRQKLSRRLAGSGKVRLDAAYDIALPRADSVGISLHFPHALVGDEEGKSACKQPRIARCRPVERPVEGRGEVEAAVGIDVVRVDELNQTYRCQVT